MFMKCPRFLIAGKSHATSWFPVDAGAPQQREGFAVVPWNGISGESQMDEKQAAPQPGQVQIKADEKELQGLYSNLVMVHHHAEEFTLNFVYVFPNGTQGKLLTSVIVSPGHAKRIWRALGENVSRYEAQYGPIKESPEGTPGANIGFVQ
jgi:hypothetical protein